jgi:phosphoserine / homoserine phosphotransferase
MNKAKQRQDGDLARKPTLIASDLEGVFVPEIWVAVAEKTGITELQLTTREISDYDELMGMRLQVLQQNGLSLHDIQEVIASISPLHGAAEFLAWVRARTQLIIISDTFYEFVMPLMAQLDYPTIFCHSLNVTDDGTIVGYQLRLPSHSKRLAVQAFRDLGFRTMATGDSYNDTAMLATADSGILFCPPDNVIKDFPQFPVARSYAELQRHIEVSLLTSAAAP